MKTVARTFYRKKGASLLILFVLCAAALKVQAEPSHHEIKVPLGLVWGDSIENLEEMARPGGFSITHREEVAEKTIITVHGLLGTALRENLFVFQKNALIEIEYRYGDPSWSAQQYQDFFDSFRRMYDAKYGTSTQLISINSKRQKELTISLTGYQWVDSTCVLDLFYYSAEQSKERVYRLVSLHYKVP
ncbi:MAG: hypothetical protein DVB29_00010 [Verrucomicrobia bacterium]|nr:MAG: hypothetical protein DVB29_00010 [Verrucomicrobiota bacterium]